MNADRLLAHYEKVADAPDAIPRLRHFILDLAVRGKLVEQDPNDESASELLKRIGVEKARLVKARLIKRPKQLESVERNDTEFCIPSSWCWTRLGKVTSYIQRAANRPSMPLQTDLLSCHKNVFSGMVSIWTRPGKLPTSRWSLTRIFDFCVKGISYGTLREPARSDGSSGSSTLQIVHQDLSVTAMSPLCAVYSLVLNTFEHGCEPGMSTVSSKSAQPDRPTKWNLQRRWRLIR